MNSHKHSVERLAIIETGRHRRWSDDEKLRIVTESLTGPRLASATARRYGISRGQLFTWRRELRIQPAPDLAPQMVCVRVEDAPKASRSCAGVEIILPSRVRIVVAPDIDPAALARIVTVLSPRWSGYRATSGFGWRLVTPSLVTPLANDATRRAACPI